MRTLVKRTFTAAARIAAPPERVWSVLSDVRRWPEWLPTVTAVEPLGPEALAVGARYRIRQPRLRPAIWSVVGLEPRRSFSWESRSPGVRALGVHVVSPASAGSTEVTVEIRFSGFLSYLVAPLAGGLTADYLTREAAALKQRAEATS
jgi:hypothetical protein